MAKVIGTAVSSAVLVLGLGLGFFGCGEPDAPSAAQLEQAKEEGERAGRESARVDALEKEVRNLRRNAREFRRSAEEPQAQPSTPAPVEQSGPEPLRSFHAPSGNVSCAITSEGAFCTVDSISTTFRLQAGSPGKIESGTALPRGYGELIGFGNTISAGSVTCTIPESNEPKGIICLDGSGHGFEASRVSERQKAF